MLARPLVSALILSAACFSAGFESIASAAEDGSRFFTESWRPPETLPGKRPELLYANKMRAKFIGEANDGLWADQTSAKIKEILRLPDLAKGKLTVSCRVTMCQIIYYEPNISGDVYDAYAKRQAAIAKAFVTFTKEEKGGISIINPEYLNNKDGFAILSYYDKNETE